MNVVGLIFAFKSPQVRMSPTNSPQEMKNLQISSGIWEAGDETRTRNPQLGKLMRYHCATPAQDDLGDNIMTTAQKDKMTRKVLKLL